jgi:tRNA A58 N-methylase Trm61
MCCIKEETGVRFQILKYRRETFMQQVTRVIQIILKTDKED